MTEIIKGGVKEVKRSLMYSNSDVELIVKKVKPNIEYSQQSGVFHPDCVANHVKIEKVIEGGIKVVPLPDMSGELRGYSDYYNTKEDRTKPHTEYVKETIEGGTKVAHKIIEDEFINRESK